MADNFRFGYLDQTKITESQIDDINALLKQLSKKSEGVDASVLKDILSQSGVFVLVVKNLDDRIVGMATLAIRRLLLNKTGIIGDVVVDEKYRGMKLGKIMMEFL